MLWSIKQKGDAIKYLIAVLLSALLTLLLVPKQATPNINIQARVVKTTRLAKVEKPISKPKTPIGAEKATVPPSVGTKGKQTPPALAQASEPKETVTTYKSGCSTYDSIFRSYTWDVSVAEAICEAESSGDPYQLSSTCDRGLMQINCIHSDMVHGALSSLYNPTTNIAVAYKIYSANGWSAWTTYLTGAYVQFL